MKTASLVLAALISLFLSSNSYSAEYYYSISIDKSFELPGISKKRCFEIFSEVVAEWDRASKNVRFIASPNPDVFVRAGKLKKDRIGEFYGVPRQDGIITFDNTIEWNENLFKAVALHETAHHLLGMAHNDKKDSVLYPQSTATKLSPEDIRRFRLIHGD